MEKSYWDFWINAEKVGNCWDWKRSRKTSGYGNYYRDGKVWSAHHFAYTIAKGPIPKDSWILHRCDNPPCVRPQHLYAGNAKDNAQDRKNRNRSASTVGSNNGRAKVNAEKVVMIIEKYLTGKYTQKELAIENGITPSAVHSIVKRRNWKHIEIQPLPKTNQ